MKQAHKVPRHPQASNPYGDKLTEALSQAVDELFLRRRDPKPLPGKTRDYAIDIAKLAANGGNYLASAVGSKRANDELNLRRYQSVSNKAKKAEIAIKNLELHDHQ